MSFGWPTACKCSKFKSSRTPASPPSCVTFSTWCWTIPTSNAESVPEWCCWSAKSRSYTASSPEFVIWWEHVEHLPRLELRDSACFQDSCMHVCVWLAGPGVFHKRLWGDRHRTQLAPLCRGQTPAAARGEMSNTGSRNPSIWYAHKKITALKPPQHTDLCQTHPEAAPAELVHVLPHWIHISYMLVDMCGCIPARSAELSTGNLLNANHTEETLKIINQIRDACEPA